MTQYVALVCRLSPRPDGSYDGVDLQERWGREYATKKWPGLPVEVFADPGISAANGDHRPQFERFREWLNGGKVAHVWAVEQSRLERREVEWFRLAAEMEAAGVDELDTNRDGVVRVRDAVAGIKAVLNADEVRKMKKRLRDRLAENAADGQPPGSRPFGYAHGKNAEGVKTYIVVDEQAKAIRDAAAWILNGWSLANVAVELTGRGLRGAHGGPMNGKAVRKMVTNPTVAGKRVHQGHIVGAGNWPAILDENTWQACRLKLSQPRRVTRRDGGTYEISEAHAKANVASTGRKYLLTGGLATCGVCEAPLVGTTKQFTRRKNGQRRVAPYMQCHPHRGGKGCVGIMLEALESHVVRRLFTELDKPEFLDMVASDVHSGRRDEITDGLADLERRRVDLAELWATPGELSDMEWRTARRKLADGERLLRSELSTLPSPVVNVDIAAVREAWPDMLLDEQREFVRLFVDNVIVKRATPGFRQGFDGARVAIEWRRA